MAFLSFGSVLGVFRQFDRLMALEDSHRKLLDDLQTEVNALKSRMAHIEAREEIVVVKAEGAARAAAMGSATAAVVDLARRLGALEERSHFPGRASPRLSDGA